MQRPFPRGHHLHRDTCRGGQAAEFHPDIAAADGGHASGKLVEVEEGVAVDGEIGTRDGERSRSRPAVDHHVLGVQAVAVADHHHIGGREPGDPAQQADAGGLQLRNDALRPRPHQRPLGGHRGMPVQPQAIGGEQPAVAVVAGVAQGVGDVDQEGLGVAAAQGAGAPGAALVDDHGREPGGGGGGGHRAATAAAADDDHRDVPGLHAGMMPDARPGSPPCRARPAPPLRVRRPGGPGERLR